MTLIRLLIFFCLSVHLQAQNQLSFQIGMTHSNTRLGVSRNIEPFVPIIVDFSPLNSIHASLDYTHFYQDWSIGAGLAFQQFGRVHADGEYVIKPLSIVRYTYMAVPILVGRRFNFGKDIHILVRVGIDLGGLLPDEYDYEKALAGQTKPFNLNYLGDLAVGWRRFRVGGRLQWGAMPYLDVEVFNFSHTGITAYLSYVLWDPKE